MAVAHARSLGKRGRESSTPTEEWAQLARTVPATLLLVATLESERVLRCVESTHQRLLAVSVADMLRRDVAGNRHRAPRGHPPQDSCVEVARLIALHAAAGHVFAQCAARARRAGLLHGDDDAGALWRPWEGHRSEAVRHRDEAMRRLRSAMTYLAAVLQVLSVVNRRPPESPPRVAWGSEAEQLARHTLGEVAAALDAVHRMRRAIFLEFFDAWAVVLSCETRAN